jgi:hypothetical protein
MTPETPGLAALDNIRLTSSDGGIVPLKSIARSSSALRRCRLTISISSR